MPLVVIRRKRKEFRKSRAIKLRDAIVGIVAKWLEVKPHEVEVRIRKFKKDDVNCPVLAVEIDTGSARNGWRLEQRERLSFLIQRDIKKTGIIPRRLLSRTGPYVWMRVVGSSFVPIGFPKAKR